MSYSVGVQNIFELLDDETDDQPNVRTPKTKLEDDKPQPKAAPKKIEPIVGDRTPVKGAHRDPNRKEGGNQRSPARGDRPRGPRNDGDRPREDRPRGPRGPRPEGAGGSPQNVPEGGERRSRAPRHHGEERDKERWQKDNRAQASGEQNGKRVYDRRSGTGRGPKENKKGGAGGGNWGSEKDPQVELAAEQEVKEDAAKAEQTEEGAAAPSEVAAEPTEAEKPKEEEPEGVSLEEFRNRQKSSALPTLPPPRKAGEGVSDKEKDSWAQQALNQSATPTATTTKETRSAKKETVPLGNLFHVKSKEERDRAERRDAPFSRDRRERDDRKPRTDKPRGERKPQGQGQGQGQGQAKPSKPKADIVKNDQEFPTLATKA